MSRDLVKFFLKVIFMIIGISLSHALAMGLYNSSGDASSAILVAVLAGRTALIVTNGIILLLISKD